MTFTSTALPLVIAVFVFYFLDGVYTFTRLLDSLVITFIIAVFINHLVHSTRPSITALLNKCSPLLLPSNTPVSNDNHTHQRTTHNDSTSSISTNNDCPDISETPNVLFTEQLNHKEDPRSQSMQSETTASSTTVEGQQHHHPLSLECTTSTSDDSSTVHDNSTLFNSADALEQEPKSTASPSLSNSRLEQQWTSRLERHGVSPKPSLSKRLPPPTPIMSFSTPVQQQHRRYYFRDEPSPMSPPALSPSLSVSSIGSTSAYEYDLVRLRRSSRVEEMIRQFDHGNNSNHPSPTMHHQRRNSVGCGPTTSISSSRPYIKSRTFGFKPIVGVWEKRIAETADECS
ncbi:hypothetical protein K492DRAFT_208573 [Lichtheimia hyalospora FSU 10163]|nr:hypothetical protein K492DRAFT_208573 [Lichtheimia hyalospora FSU 10163]